MPKLEQNNLHELEILKQIEESPTLTNRAAATKLGVSVKLAHETLKRMVSKGLLHVKKLNSRHWDYFLTPSGIAEKARLTVEFVEFSMEFYREARRQSARVCRKLSEQKLKTVALLGSGDIAEIVYLGIQEWDLTLLGVFDDGASKEWFMGVGVQPSAALKLTDAAAIIVAVYDQRQPMSGQFLPAGVDWDERMRWIF
ncbi:MAG: winged helix-turn-helix transcriptional regulator [Lentisphaeria bacterium]|jgi:DNA-binding MarR family transcriptional regulator|nr:winged helix-turn-helix transcriptional regulator [Lentisphaeria bacterium]